MLFILKATEDQRKMQLKILKAEFQLTYFVDPINFLEYLNYDSI